MIASKADRELYVSSSKPQIWQPLILALQLFHAVVRERRKYGALGWNSHYDFNYSDFRISMEQLHLMVDNFDPPPFKALKHLTG